jgi:hypothetical protein
MQRHVKRRTPAAPGSIPAVLKMFESEVRFYLDLAWFLVSSVEPDRWSEAVDAYGTSQGLVEAMPSVMVQGYLSMADWPEDSDEAVAWNARLAVRAAML